MATDEASSISVTVRVRPFTIREAAQLTKCDDGPFFLGDGSLAATPTPKLQQKGIRSVIKVIDDKCLVFDPPEDNPMQRFSRSVVPNAGKRVKDQSFMFDRVFDENTSQDDVYEATTRGLLDSVLDGYNATVFAYGATGCGKTHTITGTAQQPGIIFLAMQELFERISERSADKETEVTLSYLEIYNETIRDLLVPGGSKSGLSLREDANQSVSVAGLSSHKPQNVHEVMDMIVKGNEYRTMSPTEANATSSRSHAVLQINVTQRDRNADVNEPHTMATLSIIDLAGSERASATKNRGERLLEGANINKSLLALGSCINALCDPRKKNHVPYRNSKLTRLLKFSLGGNCKTVMIVCVSPSSAHFDETQNTLRYANRAKNIQTKVTRNVYNVNRHVKDFLKKIDEQLAMINELKQQQRESETAAFAKFRRQSEKKDAVAREGIGRIRAAYEHSLPERKEKISYMRKQRYTERRIAMINSWIAAFEATCEAHDDDDGALLSCQAVRKTAQGILLELEGSRQHYHQRLAKLNWERTLDSALQTGLRQLADTEGATDNTHTANLTRETELLKCRGEQEALAAVLEHERGADAVMVQMLLQAHFETIALVNRLLTLDEASAVDEARAILTKILITCTDTTTCVVQPDSRLIGDEAHMPPGSTGTPKRRRPSTLSGPSPLARRLSGAAAFAAAPRRSSVSPVKGSPAKNSPRKRKVPITKKTVVFTPKKRTPTKRSVRWRDDVENGQLTEFARTPQHFDSTPEMTPSAKAYGGSRGSGGARASNSIVAAAAAAATATLADDSSSSSPLSAMQAPPSMSLHVKNKRFRSGFLAKRSDGSPNAPLPGSDSENSPLRDLEPGRASNRSALHVVHTSLAAAVPQPTDSPSDAAAAATGSADNGAVDAGSNGWSGSADPAARRTGASATELGAVAETADGAAITGGPLPPPPPRMLKSAMKRTSSMGSGAAGAGVVIVGGGGGGGGGGGALRVHRRRSPSAMMGGGGASRASSVSPPADGGLAYFTAGHARRMVRGGEKENVMQGSSVLSPRTAPIIKTSSARRSTLSSGSDGIGSSGSGSGGRHSSAGTTVVASLSSRDAIRLSMLAAAGAGSVGGSGSRSSSRESVVGSVAVGVGGGRGSWR